ncbi:hypothetical protein ACJ72_01701 [Emergomyces africanus]|uniref:Uncharacterized protein n=1 Tax=Emergomyces africanus TaxID=1955775 RepID=A0A1B7P4H5_9EURO|nr:hypothetical protein ACJ72_01701 [Emergomyces africanus]
MRWIDLIQVTIAPRAFSKAPAAPSLNRHTSTGSEHTSGIGENGTPQQTTDSYGGSESQDSCSR